MLTSVFFFFRDEDYLDEVLEKQADMIRYLKQHNSNLGKKILKLTTELNKRRGWWERESMSSSWQL